MSMRSINPATDEILETHEEASPAQVDKALARAQATFAEWRDTPFARRAELMRGAARALRARKADHARAMTLEMGKPISQPRPRSRSAPGTASTTPSTRERFLADGAASRRDASRELRRASSRSASCSRSCRGTSRSGRCFRFAAPALMAGNTARAQARVERPAAARSRSRRCSARPGFPEGAFQHAPGRARRPSSRLIDDPRVRGRHAHRQRGGAGAAVGARGRARPQEVGAGAGRLRPVHRAGRRRPRRGGRDGGARPATRTAARAASRPSGSSSRSAVADAFDRAVRDASSRRCRWAIRSTAAPTSGRWRAPTCATSSHEQVERVGRARAPSALLGGETPRGQGLLLRADRARRRRRAACPRSRGDVRPGGGGHPREGRRATRSSSPTTPTTAWAPRCGRATSTAAEQLAARDRIGLRVRQRHGRRPTRGCRSAGSSAAATVASWRRSASASSSTSRRCGSA